MELVVPAAISAQLGILPSEDQAALLARLKQLADDPSTFGAEVIRYPLDKNVWTFQLSGRIIALLRAEDQQLRVLAVAPKDQLTPYLEHKAQQAA